MRLIWATFDFPATEVDLASAKSAGAAEIISLPCPALPQLAVGYNEIAEFGDTSADQAAVATARLYA